ncbi:homoserine O-succinyltransferase [Clostridioides sp. ZZV15-6598]|uniref:homoserine O-succinyltransferase n=1 Tax=Clostridioides sp. ZZV15-6598 TaxID=2811501 RepID=UPI001D0F9B8F|nr:homoserine O-succinyltransferase [Clostridioides sp. ZZV15-6598]
MALILPKGLPVINKLLDEGIDVICKEDFNKDLEYKENIDTKIAILNLMPIKIDTELDLLRRIDKTGFNVSVEFIKISTRESKRSCNEYVKNFYKTFDEAKKESFDGFIITGAPVEQMEFEEVDYWDELKDIMDYSKRKAKSTLYICWAAQAGLYKYYNVKKLPLSQKCFGVFKHEVDKNSKIVDGFEKEFFAPHSRHTTVNIETLKNNDELSIVSHSKEAGPYIITNSRDVFVMGHSEYDKYTLDREYKRDVDRGDKISIPQNYYINDDPSKEPTVKWKKHSELLFRNWIKNYLII